MHIIVLASGSKGNAIYIETTNAKVLFDAGISLKQIKSRLSKHNIEFTDLDTVLRDSDYISVHCPLTDKTAGLINSNFIGRMKKSSYIINTSRGPVANEQDVKDALVNGDIAGYGTDVLSTEPPKKDIFS